MFQDKSVQQAVKTFFTLLNKYPDNFEHVFEFINFLKFFIRLKPNNSELPLAEIITVLREERKQIFRQIKVESRYDTFLEMATELEMDYNEAKKKLERIIRKNV